MSDAAVGSTTNDHQPPVAYIELFFDLVIVAAILVYSTRVSYDLSRHNVLWFLRVFTMLWWAWLCTTLVLNVSRAADMMVAVLIALEMLAITIMTVVVSSYDQAFRSAVSPTYGAVIACIALLNEWLARRGPPATRLFAVRRRNFFALSAALWILAGFLASPIHVVLWFCAAAAMFIPVFSERFNRGIAVPAWDEEHLTERFALLTLLVIGECFIKVTLNASSKSLHEINLVVLPIEVGVVFAIWLVYFVQIVPSGLPASTTRRRIWMGAHLILQAGLVGLAVGLGHFVLLESADKTHESSSYLIGVPLAIVLLSLAALVVVVWGRDARIIGAVLVLGAIVSVVMGLLFVEISAISINQGALIFGVIAAAIAGVTLVLGRPLRMRSSAGTSAVPPP